MKRPAVWGAAARAVACALAGVAVTAAPRDPGKLRILQPDFPRAFFFRASEGPPANPRTDYEAWSAEFSRLMGIMGKCLDEEVVGRERRNPAFFSRFKRDHPDQAVLLHLNGNARDPRYQADSFFPGHWIYRQATLIRADVPAEPGETDVAVEDARLFRVNIGRYRDRNDDVALFGLAADGRHDWGHCEQVRLVSVDLKQNTIRVRRGQYGTKPLAFKAGKARAAAHQVEGPWGKTNNLMWYYNYCTHCPKDREGRTAADRYVDDIARWFGPGGPLAEFDGLEFDVLFSATEGDTDGDGTEDGGIVGGVNRYAVGVTEFARSLRARMGDTFLLLADGALGPGGVRSQRAFGLLNGIESEGWPDLRDWEIEDWSGGLNRHVFWQANGRSPAFSYINHKFTEPVPGEPGQTRNPEVGFNVHRLVFAAACLTDTAVCYAFAPASDPGGRIGVWDELRCGADDRLGWLGKPEGSAAHLAAATPDLLGGEGTGGALARRIAGPVEARATADGVVVAPRDPRARETRFAIRGLAAGGSDLFLAATLRAAPRAGCPPEMGRYAELEISSGVNLMGGMPDAVGTCLRGAAETGDATADGASFQRRTADLGGQSRLAYAVHPPFRGGAGYLYWTRDVDVPPDALLTYAVGMGPKSPERSDGVWFQVFAAELQEDAPGAYRKLAETATKAHAWLPQTVPLEAFAGRRIRLKFVADPGPKDHAVADHAHWADVQVLSRRNARPAPTEPQAYMTWLNGRDVDAGFYFRRVASETVDLTFTVEGPEPVTIRSVTAHAHPDAMARVFEKGIVLANPGLKPYTFDLGKLSPGRAYRRLRGTPAQDPKTNDGSPVAGPVTLGPKDALFLVRTNGGRVGGAGPLPPGPSPPVSVPPRSRSPAVSPL